MQGIIAALALAGAFLLFLSGVSSRPAKADHCPDWARTCVHPFEAVTPATARRARAGRHVEHRSLPTAGLPAPLITAIADVQRQCPGFRVISTFRRGARVRGSGRPSLHASNRAADIAGGDFGCAYRALAGFQGGVTTDAHRVRPPHIHLSWAPGSGEWGRRFAHYGGRKTRHARRSARLARR